MNSEKIRRQILDMGIGVPFVLLAATWTTAFWLASSLLILVSSLRAVDLLLPASLRPSLRQTILLIAAAAASSIMDLLLQAYAWPQHVALHLYWPIIAIASLGLLVIVKDIQPRLTPRLLARSAIMTACMILLAGGLTQSLNSTGKIVFLPSALLLFIGCVCALAQHLHVQSDSPTSRKIRRVRVTGPAGR